MTVMLATVRNWSCPNCPLLDQTHEAQPHTRYHICSGLNGLTAPMVPAGTAAGTGAALDATAATAPYVNAEADVATGTGAAANPTTDLETTVGLASGTGTAADATVETSVAGSANAEAAAGTGTAQNVATAVLATSGAATGTGQALDASATSEAVTNANAGVAQGTGAASTPSGAVQASTEAPSGIGAALDATAMVGNFTLAEAQAATGSGLAFNASVVSVSSTVQVGPSGGKAPRGRARFGRLEFELGRKKVTHPSDRTLTPLPVRKIEPHEQVSVFAGVAHGTGAANGATVSAECFAMAGVATGYGSAMGTGSQVQPGPVEGLPWFRDPDYLSLDPDLAELAALMR